MTPRHARPESVPEHAAPEEPQRMEIRSDRKAKAGFAAAIVGAFVLVLVAGFAVAPAAAEEPTGNPAIVAAQERLADCQAMRAEARTSAERTWGDTCVRLAQRALDGLASSPSPSPSSTATPAPSPTTPAPSPTTPPATAAPPATTSPPTTTPPTPSPTPTTPSGCDLPLYPTPACTGTPAGWSPSRIVSGDYTARSGELIDGWRITGSLWIRGDNVTVRNSEVYTRIYNQASGVAYNGLLVEDVTIGPPSGNSGATTGAIGVCGYTARRVEIRNAPEGFRVGGYGYSGNRCGPVLIEDSFAKLTATGCDHTDGIQEYDGIPPGMVARHNTIDMRGVSCSTAPIYVGEYGGTFSDNLIMGGSYTLRLHRDGSNTRYPQVTGNRLVDGAWDYGPALIDSCSPIQVWRDNWVVRINSAYEITSQVRRLTNCPEFTDVGSQP